MLNRIIALALLAAAACADDGLSRDAPQMIITAFEDATTRYASVDNNAPVTIDLGEVPVYGTAKAKFQIDNPSNQPLSVTAAEYETDTTGGEWLPAQWMKDKNDLVGKSLVPSGFTVPPFEKRLLAIPYSPDDIGPAAATITVRSDAENQSSQMIKVRAVGVYQGAPDIEVEYNGIVGPASGTGQCDDIDLDGNIDGCRMTSLLSFGGVGLGGQGSVRLFIRNQAACDPYPGSSPCETCVLTVDNGPHRIGLGFKPGTNDHGRFAFQGSTTLPLDLPQTEPGCSQSNFVRPVINFNAPPTEGTFDAVVVIESNDPDEPVIEIPIRAQAVNAPVAVANFRAFDPTSPSAPWTDPDDIEPYDTVYLDGRALGSVNSSHDPRDPADRNLITGWTWNIRGPSGVDPAQYNMVAANGYMNFYVPLAGHYVVELTVTNVDGLQSIQTDRSRVEFDAIPRDRLHVQLVWDDPINDQDLHLVYASQDDRLCAEPYDCHYANRTPIWFGGTAGTGANPALDVDDVNGLGPENINIEDPQPGTYRIYIHYYSSQGAPTRDTVRIWLNGLQVAEYTRALNVAQAVWAVADITWFPDGTGQVTPYPSDASGQVGTMANMQGCFGPWAFP